MSYWAKTPIKYEIKRKTKLDEKFIKRIVELAEDKLTSDMGSRKIAEIINKELKDNNIRDSKVRTLNIEKTAVNRYFKNALGKQRKVRLIKIYN